MVILILFESLTVQRLANHADGLGALQRRVLDLVDGGHVVEALTIDEELKASSHGHLCHSGESGLISVPDALKLQRFDAKKAIKR